MILVGLRRSAAAESSRWPRALQPLCGDRRAEQSSAAITNCASTSAMISAGRQARYASPPARFLGSAAPGLAPAHAARHQDVPAVHLLHQCCTKMLATPGQAPASMAGSSWRRRARCGAEPSNSAGGYPRCGAGAGARPRRPLRRARCWHAMARSGRHSGARVEWNGRCKSDGEQRPKACNMLISP